MRFEGFERHECTVNSSELAAHARAEQRSKRSCFSITVRTPSVSTLFGEQYRVVTEQLWHGLTLKTSSVHSKNAQRHPVCTTLWQLSLQEMLMLSVAAQKDTRKKLQCFGKRLNLSEVAT